MTEKEMTVKVQEMPAKPGDPGATMLFIFTMLTIMFLGIYTDYFGPQAGFLTGVIQLTCFPAYLFGGIWFTVKGDSTNGNVFLIFATCFGGIGGISNLLCYPPIAASLGLTDVSIFQFVWLWSGVSLLPVVLGMRKGPWMPFVVFGLGMVELVLMGLIGLGFLPTAFNIAVMVCFVIVGFGGFYISLAQLAAHGGMNWPLGKPLFK